MVDLEPDPHPSRVEEEVQGAVDLLGEPLGEQGLACTRSNQVGQPVATDHPIPGQVRNVGPSMKREPMKLAQGVEGDVPDQNRLLTGARGDRTVDDVHRRGSDTTIRRGQRPKESLARPLRVHSTRLLPQEAKKLMRKLIGSG
jgi:hypothetical protein